MFLFSTSEKWSPERQSNLPEVIQQMAEVGFRLSISFFSHTCYCLVAKLHLTLLRPHGLPGSSDPGISHARILELVVISFSRGSSQPRDRACVSSVFRTADAFFTCWATMTPKVRVNSHYYRNWEDFPKNKGHGLYNHVMLLLSHYCFCSLVLFKINEIAGTFFPNS